MPNLAEWLTWANAGHLLNSGFTTSLVGALAGAYAGARSAQIITERARDREILLEQIRTTNAAIMVSFTICNAYLGLKKQHIQSLHVAFTSAKADLAEFKRKRGAGEISTDDAFEFRADLRSLRVPVVPLDVLRTLVFDKLSVLDRPLALVAAISGSAAYLESTVEMREKLIERFRNLTIAERGSLPALYFGLPYKDGHTSTEYADTIAALGNLTDDLIFFSDLLCRDLIEFGERQVAVFEKRFKSHTESIRQIDFTDSTTAGLFPSAEKYADWLEGFKLKRP